MYKKKRLHYNNNNEYNYTYNINMASIIRRAVGYCPLRCV